MDIAQEINFIGEAGCKVQCSIRRDDKDTKEIVTIPTNSSLIELEQMRDEKGNDESM